MKIKYYISFLFLLTFLCVNAQSNYYYYYNGEKVYLTLDKKKAFLTTKTSFQESTIQSLGIGNIQLETNINTKRGEIEYNSELSTLDYFQKFNTLLSNPEIRNVSLYFKRDNTSSIGTSNIFYIKLNNENDLNLLQQTASQKGVTIVHQNQFMSLWCKLSVNANNPKTSLQLSNEFFETGLFADVDPAFMFHFRGNCTNDTNFGSLWGLNNSSNPSIDINACDAWSITEGNGVKVAVLDQGVYKQHNDLNDNISTLSFDTQNGSSPSVFTSGRNHGTHVAGTIAAEKDNNLQIVGVAPQSEIMSISHNLSLTPNVSEELADGINWAWQNGAEVINNSWGDQGGVYYNQLQSSLLEDAIINALNNGRDGLGTIVTFASGNHSPAIDYPASFHDDILCIGSITSSGSRSSFSGYGTDLDVVAPGSGILSTIPTQGTASWNGTSMATPHVTGIVALILSVNPCLSSQQVRDIIEQTSQEVGGYEYTNSSTHPNGTWNNEMGYGLVDAYAAVQMAQSMSSPTLDLYVKDSPDDVGTEPNTVTEHMWTSKDIWIRNNNDNGLTHQNPEYRTNGSPNYINVRVINKSCVASTGSETLTVNWAKANTALAWPQNWDGSLQNSLGFDLGNELSSVSIPIIPAGGEAIVKIPWVVPNPDNYSDNDNPWHFCLLSKINAPDDPLTSPLTSNPNVMVRNNNNLAWKNLTVVDLVADRTSAMVMIANPSNTPRTYLLELQKATNEGGKAIYEEAEVTLKMDDVIYDAWERGGKQAQLIASKREEKSKLVKGDNVILDNIMFEPNERGLLTLDFNFLTKELTDKTEFTYHVVQKDANTGEVIGGETFLIKKKSRPIFIADAGNDKEIDENETITLSAEQINEAAIYNWYDTDGNLIYQGKNLTVSADVTKKYKLEIVSEADGYKDYDEVQVKLKPSIIENISPNPASNQMQVNYKLNGVSSAYLMIIGQYGTNGSSNNYVLNTTSSQTIINLSNYTNGFYTVALVCNGQIVDAKTLIKQ
jgi:serine protease